MSKVKWEDIPPEGLQLIVKWLRRIWNTILIAAVIIAGLAWLLNRQ